MLLRDVGVVVLVACCVAFLLKTFVVRTFFIPSGSMEETLKVHDRVVVNELVPNVVPIERGDVVVFKDPGGWVTDSHPAEPTSPLRRMLEVAGLATDSTSEHLVKRVIGVGGDKVQCCDTAGRLLLNGTALDEPYISLPPGEHRASSASFDVTVPPNALWVMGDNRYNSLDSRFHQDGPGKGFVRRDEVVGRAFLISWPATRIGWLENYASTFDPATIPAHEH